MKNKKILSARLILEGLRQTLLIGLVSIFGSIILPILTFFFTGYKFANFDEINKTETGSFFGTKYLDLFLIIMSFALFFSLFRFMNNRKQSDFYNSLGFNKNCILLSYLISIQFWMLLSAILMTTVMTVCTLVKFPNGVNIGYQFLFDFFLQFIAINLLCCSTNLIAASLTGTTFAGIVTSLVIILLPQLFTGALFGTVKDMFTMLDVNEFPGFPFVSSNIVAGELTGLFGSLRQIMIITFVRTVYAGYSMSSIIYSLILAAIYFVIGLIFYNLRKSELVQRSGKPIFKALLVFAIGFTFSLSFVSSLYISWISTHGLKFDPTILQLVPIRAGIVLIVCFITWCVLNNGVKDFIKMILTYFAVIAAGVGMFFSMLAVTDYELGFQPKAEEIESMALLSDQHEYPWKNIDNVSEYFSNEGMTYFFDDVVKNMTTDYTKKAVEAELRAMSRYQSIPATLYWYEYVPFKITDVHGRTEYRNLGNADDDNFIDFNKVLQHEVENQKDKVRDKVNNIPSAENVDEFIDNVLSREECKKVYETLLAEVKSNPDEWIDLLLNFTIENRFKLDYDYYNNPTVITGTTYPLIKIKAKIDGKEQTIAMPIEKAFPKSFELYMKYYNLHTSDVRDNIAKGVVDGKKITENTIDNYIRLKLVSYEYNNSHINWGGSDSPSDFFKYLEGVKDNPIKATDDVLRIEYKYKDTVSYAYFSIDLSKIPCLRCY